MVLLTEIGEIMLYKTEVLVENTFSFLDQEIKNTEQALFLAKNQEAINHYEDKKPLLLTKDVDSSMPEDFLGKFYKNYSIFSIRAEKGELTFSADHYSGSNEVPDEVKTFVCNDILGGQQSLESLTENSDWSLIHDYRNWSLHYCNSYVVLNRVYGSLHKTYWLAVNMDCINS